MKKTILLLLSLTMLCGCGATDRKEADVQEENVLANVNETYAAEDSTSNEETANYTVTEFDIHEYKWSINYEEKGKLVISKKRPEEIVYEIPMSDYRAVCDPFIYAYTFKLYCYGEHSYIFVYSPN